MHIRPFEIALIGTFAILGIVGIFMLSIYKPDESDTAKLYGDRIEMWGTLDEQQMNSFLTEAKEKDPGLGVVEYRQIDERAFDSELLNAIAEGRSPDLVIMPHTRLVSYRNKLQPLSYENMPERTFRDRYIDGAEIFMRSDGVFGVPIAVDPLVMYWNRDIFSSSGLAQPPKTWETLVGQTTEAIVRKNDDYELTQSAVSFGVYTNVAHGKEILAMLFLQAGSNLVEERDGYYMVTLGQSGEDGLAPGEAGLKFFTQFSAPSSSLYSWNRSRPLDRTEFLRNTLGMYFGMGSEKKALERENANLNFDIAPVPQGSGVTVRRNYGDIYAFMVPRASRNISGAYSVAFALSSAENASMFVDRYNFAPAHRALYTGEVNDPYKAVLYESALIARGWLDPSPSESDTIFRTMVEDVSSGRTRLKNVIVDTVYALEALF